MRRGRGGVYESMRYLEISEEYSFVSACNSWSRTSTEMIALFEAVCQRINHVNQINQLINQSM
jgi:hypothetical protein